MSLSDPANSKQLGPTVAFHIRRKVSVYDVCDIWSTWIAQRVAALTRWRQNMMPVNWCWLLGRAQYRSPWVAWCVCYMYICEVPPARDCTQASDHWPMPLMASLWPEYFISPDYRHASVYTLFMERQVRSSVSAWPAPSLLWCYCSLLTETHIQWINIYF